MDFNTIDKIIDSFRKRPKRTILILSIVVVIALIGVFFSGYFSELGKKFASDNGTKGKAELGIQIGDIKTGDQSPVIVGDKTTITYSLKDIKGSNKPFFDFIAERKCQDPSGKYCDEKIYIINLGSEPRENVLVTKSPLPDNAQIKALTGYEQLRINKPLSKHISILGVGVDHKKLLYRERSYSGKNVRIIVRCRIDHNKYEITYEGEPRNLKLKKRTPVN